ncbi:MAG: enoyl-CoA hydratase [Alphaproteobacteria bacterium]|nr:enoyl-CoA hydratase [Alphaproteobacteria bacterium]
MSEPILLRDDADAVATLTLNRPAQRNALSRPMIAALSSALEEIGRDRAVRAVVIAANGPGYCAGHDLKEIRGTPDRAFYDLLFAECSGLMTRIVRQPQPVIACVHGIATAAGCQLVASCDLAVASEDARFATPGVNIGLFCSTPMVALSRAVSRKHAMEMLLTGDLMDAETARQSGLVNRVVPAAALRAETQGLAAKIAGKSGAVVKIGKEAFYRQLEMGLDEAYDYTSGVIAANMEMRDAEEGVDAFIAKREPVWQHR